MKFLVVFFALVAVVMSQTYDSKYDDFDAQELVENVRLLRSYGKCFLDHGPCTAEGTDFKKTIPDALKTSCAKCNPKQRQLIRTTVRGFQSKLPEIWSELVQKEDPMGRYKKEFDAFINSSD